MYGNQCDERRALHSSVRAERRRPKDSSHYHLRVCRLATPWPQQSLPQHLDMFACQSVSWHAGAVCLGSKCSLVDVAARRWPAHRRSIRCQLFNTPGTLCPPVGGEGPQWHRSYLHPCAVSFPVLAIVALCLPLIHHIDNHLLRAYSCSLHRRD